MNMFRNNFIRSGSLIFAPVFLIFNLTACFAQTSPVATPLPSTAPVSVDCASANASPPNLSEWQGSELNKAVIYSDVNAVRRLLKQNTNVNEKDGFGNTPLINAVSRKISEPAGEDNETINRKARKEAAVRWEIARLLLKNGADANVKGFAGKTPLIKAVILDESVAAKIVDLLIENKGNVNSQDNRGFTALMEAARTNRTDIIKILLKNGADKNLQNCDGETALSIAKQFNFTTAIQLLD